jgi:hypothetical protein
MKRLIPDRLSDPLLNVGASMLADPALVKRQQSVLASGDARPQAFAPVSDQTTNFRLARTACVQSSWTGIFAGTGLPLTYADVPSMLPLLAPQASHNQSGSCICEGIQR